MRFEIDVQKHLRPHHECQRVNCDNYIYGPIPYGDRITDYTCDECGEYYSTWAKRWPRYDVTFIIS